MLKIGFNSVVSARTRTAAQILATPELLDKYVGLGGLARNLEMIVKTGLDAEAANLDQSQSRSSGKSATPVNVAIMLANTLTYGNIFRALFYFSHLTPARCAGLV